MSRYHFSFMPRLLVFIFLTLFSSSLWAAPEPPSGLMTDLIEHSDRVWLDGYPSSLQLNQLSQVMERYQLALIHSSKPAFSWIVNDTDQNVLQTAWQIQLGTDAQALHEDKADLWDSGKVQEDCSVAVLYQGKALPVGKPVFWKVRTWNNGQESPWSELKSFVMADQPVDYETARYPLQKTGETPVSIQNKSGTLIADFGRAAFGQLQLTLSSEESGKTITVHFGEAVQNGRINRKPGGTIRYAAYPLKLLKGTHTYTIKFLPDKRNTGPAAVKMPAAIGEVYPFRYVEVENLPKQAQDKVFLLREMVHYPFDDTASMFRCENELLNQVWELCKYSIKATSFAGVYVDGDRERIPYEADALINQLCHYGVDREFSMARYSHEYLLHHATWPTEWILQSVLMAWYDYQYTGDLRSAEKHYQVLRSKLLLPLADPTTGLISTKTGKQTPELLRSIHFSGKELRDIVDWPHTGILGLGKSEGGETDGFIFKEYNTVVNAYHIAALKYMAVLAQELDKKEDALSYEEKANNALESLLQLCFDQGRGCFLDGIGTDHASLHANMFPLAFELAGKESGRVMDFVRSRGMACSVYGSQFLMDAVYQGQDDHYALSLLASEAERSWYNMIRVGSTISLEAWDNKYKPNQDWNHAWGAAPANILPRKLLGIEPIEPGFRMVRIMPQPGSLQSIQAKVPTIRGPILMNTVPDGYNVTIPANMQAIFAIKAEDAKATMTIDGQPVKTQRIGAYLQSEAPIGSGRHEIRKTLEK